MNVTILGSGGPIPFDNRTSSSQTIQLGEDTFLVDCGPGTSLRLSQAGISPRNIGRYFLTHLHMDHCHELPALLFTAMLQGRKDPIHVYGPAGIRALQALFFETAYPYLLPLASQVAKGLPSVTYYEIDEGPVLSSPACRVSTRRVKHGDAVTLGYRFDGPSGSLAISGDTVLCDAVVDLARGCHTLLQDCAFPDDMAGNPFHATPADVALIASRAGVERCVLTHLFPQCRGKEAEMVASVKKQYSGEVVIGTDLLTLTV